MNTSTSFGFRSVSNETKIVLTPAAYGNVSHISSSEIAAMDPHFRPPNIFSHKRSAGLLDTIEQKGKRRSGIALIQ